jgi:hypothetical protein
MVSAKIALWSPVSQLTEAPVWTANHPTKGLVLVTRYDGDWRECKVWAGKIAGTHPEFGMNREFFKRSCYAGTVFFPITGEIMVHLGQKERLSVFVWIDKDGKLTQVEKTDALSYAIGLEQDKPEPVPVAEEAGVWSALPLSEEKAVQTEYDTLITKGIPLGSFMDYLNAYIAQGTHRLKGQSA